MTMMVIMVHEGRFRARKRGRDLWREDREICDIRMIMMLMMMMMMMMMMTTTMMMVVIWLFVCYIMSYHHIISYISHHVCHIIYNRPTDHCRLPAGTWRPQSDLHHR